MAILREFGVEQTERDSCRGVKEQSTAKPAGNLVPSFTGNSVAVLLSAAQSCSELWGSEEVWINCGVHGRGSPDAGRPSVVNAEPALDEHQASVYDAGPMFFQHCCLVSHLGISGSQ